MSSPDPAAQTAAYLATLGPADTARAIAYTHGGEWLLLWNWLAGVLVCALVLRSGVLVRLREATGRRPRPNLAVCVCVACFVALDWLLLLPWTIYTDWIREHRYGLSAQPFADWLGQSVVAALIDVVTATVLAIAVYALIRRTRLWWAWSGGVMAAFLLGLIVLSPVLIEPVFNHYRPAPPGAMRDAVSRLAREAGVPDAPIVIYDGSRQSNRYTANVSGLFGSARVAMSDVMFARKADLAEVRGVVGHELGHYVLHHSLWLGTAFAILALAGAWLCDRLFPAARRLLPTAGVTGVADPAGLPVLVAILATVQLLATPLTRSMTRIVEAQADQFSLVHADEPDGLSRALVKTIAYRASSPSRLEEIVFYDHPSVQRRIRRAMEWKAAHPPSP